MTKTLPTKIHTNVQVLLRTTKTQITIFYTEKKKAYNKNQHLNDKT